MELKNNSGMTLVEIMISLVVLSIISTIVSSFLVKNEKQQLQSRALELGHDNLGTILNKIKRLLEIRDSSVSLDVQATTLRLQVPISSTSSTSYSVQIASKCRHIQNSETLVLNPKDLGVSCLQTIKCDQGLPYVEITYSGRQGSEQWPSTDSFDLELKRHAGVAGYALCFNMQANSLKINGIAVSHLRDIQFQSLSTKLISKTLAFPIQKRNGINLIP